MSRVRVAERNAPLDERAVAVDQPRYHRPAILMWLTGLSAMALFQPQSLPTLLLFCIAAYYAGSAGRAGIAMFAVAAMSTFLTPMYFLPGTLWTCVALGLGLVVRGAGRKPNPAYSSVLNVKLFALSVFVGLYAVLVEPQTNAGKGVALSLVSLPLITFLLQASLSRSAAVRNPELWVAFGLVVATGPGLLAAFTAVGDDYSDYEEARIFESSIGSSNYAAALALATGVFILSCASRRLRSRWVLLVLALPFLSAPIVFASRGALLALTITLVVATFRKGARSYVPAFFKVLGIAVVGGALLFTAIQQQWFVWQRVSTVGPGGLSSGRDLVWGNAISVVAKNPAVGIGPGQFTDYLIRTFGLQYAHNYLLELAGALGLVGGVIYAYALRPTPVLVWSVATPAIIAILTNSMVEPVVGTLTGSTLLAVFLALHKSEGRREIASLEYDD